MGLIHEAAIQVGEKTRRLICFTNNLVNPNKIRVMTRVNEETGHVDWYIVPKDSKEVIDIPTFDLIDEE